MEEGWLCDRAASPTPATAAPDRPDASRSSATPAAPARSSLEEAVDAAALVLRHGGRGRRSWWARPRRWRRASWPRSWRPAPLGGAPVAAAGHPRRRPRRPPRPAGGAARATSTRADLVVIVGGDPANQQPMVELRVRKARRARRPGGLGGPAARTRSRPSAPPCARAPGGAGGAAARGGLELPEAERVVVLWDEADLAAEPDARRGAGGARRRGSAPARSSWAPTSTAPACARSACPASGVLEAAAGRRARLLLTDPRRPDRRRPAPPTGAGRSGACARRVGDRHPRLRPDRLGHRGAAGRDPLRDRGRLRRR